MHELTKSDMKESTDETWLRQSTEGQKSIQSMTKEEEEENRLECEAYELKANMELWNTWCTTDPKYTKDFNTGRYKGTAIDPQYRIMVATKEWGPWGEAWGISKFRYEPVPHRSIFQLPIEMLSKFDVGYLASYRVTGSFFYPKDGLQDEPFTYTMEVSDSISPLSGGKYDPDWCKKIETAILMKALSKVGLGADVFLGKFDDESYIESLDTSFMNDDLITQHDRLLKGDDPCAYLRFVNGLNQSIQVSLANTPTKGKVAFKGLISSVKKEAFNRLNKWLDELREAKDNDDEVLAKEVMSDLTTDERYIVVENLDQETYSWLRSIRVD